MSNRDTLLRVAERRGSSRKSKDGIEAVLCDLVEREAERRGSSEDVLDRELGVARDEF